jgi:hypothetical protein
VRGGALPIVVWGCLLGALMALNAIWTGDSIQIEDFAFAMFVVVSSVVALTVASRRRALRRGPPEGVSSPDAAPDFSFGAALAAIGFGALIFGLAFGHFFIYFGAGVIVLGLCRVGVELHSQRRTLARCTAPAPEPSEHRARGERLP